MTNGDVEPLGDWHIDRSIRGSILGGKYRGVSHED